MAVSPEKRTDRRKPNFVYAIISMTLALFLIGFLGALLLHAQQLVKSVRERVLLMVEMQDSVAMAQIDSVSAFLHRSAFVRPGSVRFISREEAAKMMQADFGEDFLKLGLPNPFYDVFTFSIQAEYMQPDSLLALRERIKAQYPFVNDVFYQENVVDAIANNLQRLRYLAIVIGILLIGVAAALIYNTNRLALYANRFLIKNMELVGASWEFISRPYLIRGVWHGLISGLLAVGGLMLLLLWARTQLPDLRELQDLTSFATLFAGIIILGILISTASAYLVVRKYLQMRVDDLY